MLYNIKKLFIEFKVFEIMSTDNTSQFALTITFTDPDLNAGELNEEAVRLLADLNDRSDIGAVDRVRDPNPPEGNKSIGGFFVGMLAAEVSATNVKKVLGFLGVA